MKAMKPATPAKSLRSIRPSGSIRHSGSIKPSRSTRPFHTLIVFILALMMISMYQDNRKERVQDCASKAGDGAIYLKEFVVSLPKGAKDEPPPVYRQAVILRGNNIYRFNLCNDKGQAILRIYDNTNMVVSSFDTRTNKEYNPINFLCRKTGQYIITINFKDGKAGEAVGIMSHVMK
jgi:hypothetical protein